MPKRLLCLVAALCALAIVIVPISGCGETVEEDGVIFWHAMAGDLKDVLEKIVSKFNEGRTKNRIILRYQGEYGNLKNKITSALRAGAPPDMAQMYEAWTAYYNSEKGRESLLPLNDYMARDAKEINVADIYPVMLEDNTFDGQVYSFPFNKSFPCLFYNKALFLKAGLDPAKPPATWTEFAAAGRKIRAIQDAAGKQTKWGWAFNVDPWIFCCMVLQNGGKLAEGDTKIMPLDSKEMLQAIRYYMDAIDGSEPFAYRSNGREFQNDFISQRVGMIVTTCVSRSFMIDQISFDLGMAPLPQGDVKKSIMSGTNIGIFAKSPKEKQEVAWEFIKFFTSTDQQAFWAMSTGYVPVRKSSVESPAFRKFLEKSNHPMAAIDQLPIATFEPRAQAWADIRDQLNRALLLSLLKKRTPEENLEKVQQQLLGMQGEIR
jgi:ABC-type glycerol-3-phosphate transport system substrate-binding protein